MSHGDDISTPHKQVGLSKSDLVVDDLRGAGNDEQGIAVLFDLRMLMGFARVFDCQVMEAELVLNAG